MNVHQKKPVRSTVQARKDYREYRDELRRDFNCACGYCDDSDLRSDRICFHIDHFAPKKRFPHLETTYINLVYACRFCNVRKSDHWIGEDPSVPNDGAKGFIDPCTHDFDSHLERNSRGQIIGKSELGKYIAKRLSLNLMRHELLWKTRRMLALREESRSLRNQLRARSTPQERDYIALLERIDDLTERIEEYEFSSNHG